MPLDVVAFAYGLTETRQPGGAYWVASRVHMAPKTVLDKIVHCIRQLKEHSGSSRQMIHKYLKSEFSVEGAAVIKAALKKGVAKGKLTQNGQRFLVTGETYEPPIDETVSISVLKEGTGEPVVAGDQVKLHFSYNFILK